MLVAAALAVVVLVWGPLSPDLAAQTARGALFDRAGPVPWWSGWYGGIDTGGYSLVTPALLGVLGPLVCGALALVATSVVAVPLLGGTRRPVAAGLALALTAWLDVLAGRTTFALGIVVALGALVAVRARRPVPAAALGLLTVATSPVAGLLLLVPAGAPLLVSRGHRAAAAGACLGVAAGLGAVALLFPAGGLEPFAGFVYRPAVALALAPALLPVGRLVRCGALLAAVATTASFVLTTPVGSNVTRLVLVATVPGVVATVRGPWPVVALLAGLLLVWPLQQIRIDLRAASSPAVTEAFTAGLLDRLAADPLTAVSRVEVVPSATHWPESRLAPTATLARGWERQTDEGRNPLFYGRAPLTPKTYRAWLERRAVALIAVPQGVRIDFGGGAEADLVARGLPYLREVWRDPHWRLYAVNGPAPVVTGGRLVRFTDDGADLVADRPGRVVVRAAWSRWLRVDGGRVVGGTDQQVVLDLDTAGPHALRARWLG